MHEIDLNYVNGIAGPEFIDYVLHKFEFEQDRQPDALSPELLDSIVNYGRHNKQVTKDSFAYFLFDIIPGLEFAEAAAFIDNSLLTSDAQAIKNKFWLDENEGGYKKMSLLHSDPQAYFELLKNAGGAEA